MVGYSDSLGKDKGLPLSASSAARHANLRRLGYLRRRRTFAHAPSPKRAVTITRPLVHLGPRIQAFYWSLSPELNWNRTLTKGASWPLDDKGSIMVPQTDS